MLISVLSISLMKLLRGKAKPKGGRGGINFSHQRFKCDGVTGRRGPGSLENGQEYYIPGQMREFCNYKTIKSTTVIRDDRFSEPLNYS